MLRIVKLRTLEKMQMNLESARYTIELMQERLNSLEKVVTRIRQHGADATRDKLHMLEARHDRLLQHLKLSEAWSPAVTKLVRTTGKNK